MINQHIKFDLSEDGGLPFNSGKVGFADILSIGALIHTKKHNYEPGKVSLQYRTDEAGIKQIINTAERALETINDMVNVLGLLLVCDPGTINEHDITRAGWSLVALSELSAAIDFELGELHYAQLCQASKLVNPPAKR